MYASSLFLDSAVDGKESTRRPQEVEPAGIGRGGRCHIVVSARSEQCTQKRAGEGAEKTTGRSNGRTMWSFPRLLGVYPRRRRKGDLQPLRSTRDHAPPRSVVHNHAPPRSVVHHHAPSCTTMLRHAASCSTTLRRAQPRSTKPHRAPLRSVMHHQAPPRSATLRHAANIQRVCRVYCL